MKISNRNISSGSDVLVIAEIGVNHDGRVERALELVDHARAAGADAVKLQIFSARTLMHESTALAGYQAERCADGSAREMLSRCELTEPELASVVREIRRRGMIPLATPFSPADVARIEALDLPGIKIASPDVVNWPLLRRAAGTGLPLLVSTGASTMEEIGRAAGWLGGWRAEFALLHCVSAYPTASADAHLGWIGELSAAFGTAVGYSDHTNEMLAGALAAAAGAAIIEKHLTYDRGASGPDHSASFDPGRFAEYVKLIRRAAELRGAPGRRVLGAEEDVRRVSRQSLVLVRGVGAGERIEERDLTVQRPGTGIPAAEMPRVVGRRSARAIGAGTLLTWDMLHAA